MLEWILNLITVGLITVRFHAQMIIGPDVFFAWVQMDKVVLWSSVE